ncbi:hypothetical protein SASPL_129093 [Salvia splendens]|uniref:RRM domain-containing protein n=1 Tax=Salvia splendens TaxID=180675 RepID=A0A8X8XDV5_SALSN|nr:hypothetical protein SASPL_129093 [Salvia splendens]
MEDLKKRKLDELGNSEVSPNSKDSTANSTIEELRALLDPLAKPQLVDILARALIYGSADIYNLRQRRVAMISLGLSGQCDAVAEKVKTGRMRALSQYRSLYGGCLVCVYMSSYTTLKAILVQPGGVLCGLTFVCGCLVCVYMSSYTTLKAILVQPGGVLCGLTFAFIEHGEIEEGAVIYDKVTGKSRGYGFVTFKDMESAQTALKAPSKMIDGRMAVCNLASEGLSSNSITPDQAQRKLYVGGLSPETTSEMLLAFFSRHGEIEEGSVAYEKDTNKSRGFGFVTYKTVEAAKRAIDDPQKLLGGRNITAKLADNYKGKVTQSQIPSSAVPVPVHMNGGAPMGYGYPQPMAAYPPASYTNPQTAAAPPYAVLPHYSYPQYGVKKDTPPPQMAMGGYPSYYMPKQ